MVHLDFLIIKLVIFSKRKNDKFLELITEHSGDFLENSNYYMHLIITLTMTIALTKSSDYRVA